MNRKLYSRRSYRVALTCGSIGQMLEKISAIGITLRDVEFVDELKVCATVNKQDYNELFRLVTATGNACEILGNIGLGWVIDRVLKRPVLVIGVLLYCMALCYLPTRVLFVRVEGNQRLTSNLIIEKAEACGISFGASRRDVRSEQVKNALLGALPDLQWAGINTSGCVAVISVRERTVPEKADTSGCVSSIVACMDCIIRDVTVIRGNSLCVRGQAVKAGQILVSGYTDCGICVKAESAEAEIFGETSRMLTAKTPSMAVTRADFKGKSTVVSLKIGKNIIKLTKGSGISGAGCVKMYSEYYLMLPGGFQLPVSVIVETMGAYDTCTVDRDDPADYAWVEESLEGYALSEMQAGKILRKELQSALVDGCYIQYGDFSCLEQVGRVRNEEILERYVERN